MTKVEFVTMYQKLFPRGDAEEFCDKVCIVLNPSMCVYIGVCVYVMCVCGVCLWCVFGLCVYIYISPKPITNHLFDSPSCVKHNYILLELILINTKHDYDNNNSHLINFLYWQL